MSFPTPQLPTDNLYKFLTLSGLVLAVACLALQYQAVTKLEAEVKEGQEAMFEGHDAAASLLYPADVANWFIRTDNDVDSKPKSNTEDAKKSLKEYEYRVGQMIVDLAKRLDENKAKLTAEEQKEYRDALTKAKKAVFSNRNIVERIERTQSEVKQLGYFGTGGLALLFFGFLFWNYRVQRWQDMILRNEALTSGPKSQEPSPASLPRPLSTPMPPVTNKMASPPKSE